MSFNKLLVSCRKKPTLHSTLYLMSIAITIWPQNFLACTTGLMVQLETKLTNKIWDLGSFTGWPSQFTYANLPFVPRNEFRRSTVFFLSQPHYLRDSSWRKMSKCNECLPVRSRASPSCHDDLYKSSIVTEWLWLSGLGTFQFPLLLEEGQTLAATKALVEVPLAYVYV